MGSKYFSDLTKEELEILSIIQKEGPVGKEVLLSRTGYKSTSINRILNALKGAELIEVSGEGESTGGRRPLLYSIREDLPVYALGVSIALNHIDVSIMHFGGKIVGSKVEYEAPGFSPEKAVEVIGALYRQELEETGILGDRILSAGCAVAAAMDRSRDAGGDWVHFPLREKLEEMTGVPAVTDSSTAAGCIGEYLFGEGKNCRRISYFACRNSFRVSCIQDGIVIRSPGSTEDAFGHMVVNIGGKRCACGNYGCLKTYASLDSIREDFLGGLRQGRVSLLQDRNTDSITGGDILAAGDQGDQLAAEVISRAASTLGIGIANYVKLVNPDLIVLNGELFRRSRLYFDTVQSTARRQLEFTGSDEKIGFVPNSEVGRPVNGAAVMALEMLLGRRY